MGYWRYLPIDLAGSLAVAWAAMQEAGLQRIGYLG